MQVFSALGLGGGWDILWIWTTVIASDKSQDVDQALCVRLDLSGWGVFQSFSHVRFFVTPRTAAHQALLSFNISWSLLKLMSIESAMPSNHLIFCRPLLLLPSIFPSLRVFPQRVGSSHQVAKVLEKGIIPNDCSVQVGGSLWADGPKADPLRAEEGQTSPESVFTLQEGQEPPKPRSTVQ